MATERIDSIIDIPAVSAEYEKLNQYLNDLVASMEKVANSKIGAASQAQGIAATQAAVADLTQSTAQLAGQQEKLVSQAQTIVNTAKQQISTNAQIAASVKQYSGSIEENIRLQLQFSKQLQDNKKIQTDLQAAYKEGKIGADAFGQSQVVLQKQQLELKSTISGLNSTLKQQTQENQAAEDSYRKLSAQLVQLRAAYRGMSEAEKSSQGGQGLQAQIAQLDQALKGADGEMGIHVRHVGNYTGALKTLETGLSEASAQLQRYTETGQQNTAQAQQARAEVDLFTQLLAQQEKGFTSLSREIMATGKALETMAEQGLQGTETFKRMEQQFVEGRRELNEFRKNQALLTSEAPKLQALTLAAKGLAGMYALGAGTAALFADGNEKVEKELNKMVAVMTVLQGLHEVHELLEKRTALATIASSVAEGFKNFVLTGSVKVQKEKNQADLENTAIQEGNLAITEADVVAKEAQAGATEEVAVATNSATSAMVKLRFAVLASGLGALLLFIPLLASAMNSYGEESKKAAKDAADFAEAMEKMNEILMEQIRLSDDGLEHMKKYLENALVLAEKNKQSFIDISAIKKNQLDLEQKQAENDLKRAAKTQDVADAYRTINEQVEKLKPSLDALSKKQEELESFGIMMKSDSSEQRVKALNQFFKEYGEILNEQELKTQKENASQQYEAQKKLVEQKKGLLDAYDKAYTDQTGHEIENSKFSEEEQRKLALLTAKIRMDTIVSANDRIVNDERSSQGKIISAMDSSLRAQLTYNDKQKSILKEQLAAREITPGEYQRQLKELNAIEEASIDKSHEDIRKKNLEFWKREMAAQLEIQKGGLQQSSEINQQISDDQDVTLDRRILAYKAYEDAQRRIIDEEYVYKLLTGNLKGKEIEAAAKDHQDKLNELTRAGIEKRKAFQKESVETVNAKAQSELSQNYNADVSALAESLVRKRITQEKYNEERKKLDEQYEMDQIRVDMETTRQLIALTADGTKERYDLEKKLAEDNIKLTGLQIKSKEEYFAKQASAIDKWVKKEQQAANIVGQIISISTTRRLNNIQREEEANTKAKDKEITDINISSLSAQDKAAKLIQVEEQAKVTQDRLDKEKRDTQLRQARFDRDQQVLSIIGNTLVAAAKAGWWNPIAWAIEAEGFTQAALLAAKPLPHFEKGTDNAPEGWAWTDEKGPELYRRPSGEVFLGNNRPTLRYLEAGTEITANDQIDKVLYNQMIRGTANLIMPAQKDDTAKEIRGLRSDLQAQTDRLEKAYQQAKRPIVIIQKPDLKSRYIP